jgi:hypothetical protein
MWPFDPEDAQEYWHFKYATTPFKGTDRTATFANVLALDVVFLELPKVSSYVSRMNYWTLKLTATLTSPGLVEISFCDYCTKMNGVDWEARLEPAKLSSTNGSQN